MEDIRKPTADECSNKTVIFENDNEIGYAIWYPQMGGYVGKAVALVSKTEGDSCFDVLVWHDGDWPFHDGEQPRRLHHCEAQQFIEFGIEIQVLQKLAAKQA